MTGDENRDDALFYLSTSGSGVNRLPFALQLYNVAYRSIAISTNGNVQFGVQNGGGNATFINECLRSTAIAGPAVFPFWDDLIYLPGYDSMGFPQGVFTKTTGAAPHRTFIISWQGVLFLDESVPVTAQVFFREGSQNFTTVYGSDGGASATIGVQSRPAQNRVTQYACDSGDGMTVTDGLRLIFTHVN